MSKPQISIAERLFLDDQARFASLPAQQQPAQSLAVPSGLEQVESIPSLNGQVIQCLREFSECPFCIEFRELHLSNLRQMAELLIGYRAA